MTARTHRRVMLSSALGIVTLLASVLPGAAAEPPDGWSATGLSPAGRVEGFKSASADLVKSDADLIKRTDGDRVRVMVKLDYDALASYAGGIEDLAATSPRVTGKDLTGKSKAEKAYAAYIKGEEAAIVKAMKAAAPSIRVGSSLRTVYGGVAATVAAREAKTLLKVAGRRRGAARLARAAADRLQLRVHRRHAGPAGPGWPAECRQRRHLRQPRHRRLAGASVLRRPGPPAAPRRRRPTARRAPATSATTR